MKAEFRIVTMNCIHEFLANGKFWAYAVNPHRVVLGAASLDFVGEWGWINDLFVGEHHRRRGIARRLVRVLLNVCNDQRWMVGAAAGLHPGNEPSIRLFESLGFRHVFDYPDTGTRLYSARLADLSLPSHEPVFGDLRSPAEGGA